MKKTLITTLLSLCAVFTLSAGEPVAAGIWFNSTADNVEGVGFGLPIIGTESTAGASLAFCGNHTEKMDGLQFSFFGFNFAESLEGVQLSLVNIQEEQHGDFALQWGLYNQSGENGIQVGFINNASNNASFQLGFININKNGLLPVMLFINFGSDIFD